MAAIGVSLTNTPYRGGRTWRRLAVQANALSDQAERAGRPIYGRPPEPPGLLRLMEWWQTDGSRDTDLQLRLQPTWFWAMLGSNRAAEMSIPKGDWGLADVERVDACAIGASLLANPLSVNLAIVFAINSPPLLLVQHRGRAIRRAGELYQVSAAGYVDRTDYGGMPLPWQTAVRETWEETGIALQDDQIVFLSLCRGRDRGGFTPGLCGLAELAENSVSELQARHDLHEVDGYEYWPFEPGPIMRRVRAAGGWSCFVPLGAATVVCALAARYGDEAVVRAWEDSVASAATSS